jgi:hypothetical protein
MDAAILYKWLRDSLPQFARPQEACIAGGQDARTWAPAAAAQRGVVFTAQGDALCGYAITVSGFNALISIETGTSEKHLTERVRLPARFTAWGPVTIHAVQLDPAARAEVRTMVGFTNAPQTPDVAGQETGPVGLQESAVAVRALDAVAMTVGGVAVALVAGQAIELRGPATLISGTVTVLYEP